MIVGEYDQRGVHKRYYVVGSDSDDNTWSADIFLYKLWRPEGFFQFEIINSKKMCYGSTIILNILIFQCGDRL